MSVAVDLGLPDAAEDSRLVWSRSWVAAGVADVIPEVGDILPATIGDHGVHVTREAGGDLVAGYNALQQGSCWNLPAQCGNGSKVACAYVSCGHSRDGDVVRARDGRSAVVRQLLGTRPNRRVRLPMATMGPVLFVGLDPQERLDEQMPGMRRLLEDRTASLSFLGAARVEMLCGWRDFDDAVAAALEDGSVPSGAETLHRGGPNLVVACTDDELTVLTAKPVNQARIEVGIASYATGTGATAGGADRWRTMLAGR